MRSGVGCEAAQRFGGPKISFPDGVSARHSPQVPASMASMGAPANDSCVVVDPSQPGFPNLEELIALGDLHKSTLGVLPHAAYRQYALDGTIVAAIHSQTFVGYSVFTQRTTRQDLKLIHLCVGVKYRGLGVARALVDAISSRYSNSIGIAAYCRRDYDESKVWSRLNFAWRGERPGRKKGTFIDGWFRSHGHADLFMPALNEQRLVVAIDTSILSDLAMPDSRPGSADSTALTADWLDDEIELVITQAVSAEAHDTTDPARRHKIASKAASIRTLHANETDMRALYERILHEIAPAALAKDRSLIADAKVLAQSIAGGADMLVTRDANAVTRFQSTLPLLGEFRIVHPVEVSGQLDRLRRRMTYQPSRLLNTGFSVHPPQGNESGELESLLNMEDGELRRDFKSLLRDTAHTPQAGRWSVVVRSPDSSLAAFYTHQNHHGVLTVPIIRVARSRVEHTLARQIVHGLRRIAVAAHCDQVLITDPAPTRAVLRALGDSGFSQLRGGWTAVTMQLVASYVEVAAAFSKLLGLDQSPASRPLTPQEAGQLEGRLWPAKIADAPLTSYLVPIQERFALDLLGSQPTLTDRPSDLGLACEHIYYRAPVAIEVRGPGRIVWYETRPRGLGTVVGCSRLIDVQRASPAVLHEEYGRFGVWKIDQIEAVSRKGLVEALHFADTELFDQPITLNQLKTQAPKLPIVQGPRRIPPELFMWIYKTGQIR